MANPQRPTVNKPWFAPWPSTQPDSVTVIGAGLAGCATAAALAQAGCSVTLLEAGEHVAGGASRIPGMLVRPFPEKQPSAASSFYEQAANLALEYLAGRNGWHAEPVFDAEQGVKLESSGWIHPEPLCESLVQNENIHVQLQQQVCDISWHQNWTITLASGEIIPADNIVLACGADYIPSFAEHLPLQTVAGQISLIKVQPSIQQPTLFGGYAIPMDNSCLVGSSYEKEGVETTTYQTDFAPFVEEPVDFTQAKTIRGARLVSQDHMPLIGPLPLESQWQKDYADLHHGKPLKHYPTAQNHPNIWMNQAHGSRGATGVWLAAQIIAAEILGKPCPVDSHLREAIHPGRFLIRALKKR